MKHVLLFIILNPSFFIGTSYGQSDLVLDWANSFGGISSDAGHSIAVDGSGNVYVTGNFQGTADFDPSNGTANLTSTGWADIFLAKYDASGNFVFANSMGGTIDDEGISIAVDGLENVYVTGYFHGTVDFDPTAGTANLTSLGETDVFIVKYDANGNYVYAKGMGGTTSDSGNSIDVDGSGNVYVTGHFSSTADFDPGVGVVNLSSAGGWDIFLAKYDANGNYVYAQGMGGTDNDQGRSITVDGFGNVYMTGDFSDTADFDPAAGTASLTSAGSIDIFIAKYDAAGNYIYAKSMGGLADDRGFSIVADGSGNVHLTGNFQDTADFDPSNGTSNLTSSGWSDIFLAKYDAAGNYVYAKNLGGVGIAGSFDRPMVMDNSGNLYVTGMFVSTNDFDPSGSTANLQSAGGGDLFLAKYQADGNYVYATAMGGSLDDIGYSIATDGFGNVYLTGAFQGSADFDPGVGTANLTSAGPVDIFVARYTEGTTGISRVNGYDIPVIYASNSWLYVDCSNCSASAAIELYDLSGRLVGAEKVQQLNGITAVMPLNDLCTGIYIGRVATRNQIWLQKMVLSH